MAKKTAKRPAKKAKKATRASKGGTARRVVDPHPCYTQYVPGSNQVLQCCWDESINDYRCRPI
jgi:hypothetical protein